MKKIIALLFVGVFACNFEVSAQTTPTTAVSIDTVSAQVYVGKYKIKDGPFEEMIVTIQNGKLMGEAVGQGTAELIPTKEADIFTVSGYDGTLEFIRNESKAVVKAKLTVQGNVMEGEKQ